MSAVLAVVAALCYAAGFVAGRAVAFALWCWTAMIEGYRAGL